MKQLKRAVEKQPIYAFFVFILFSIWTSMLIGVLAYFACDERLDIDYAAFCLAAGVIVAMLVGLYESGAE